MNSTDEVVRALLQTAALPEIFPSRLVDGMWTLDGGLVDNTPILPGIAFGASSEDKNILIVVYLDNRIKDGVTLLEEEKQRVRSLARRWEFLLDKPNHALSQLLDQQFSRCRFIAIIPSAHLGNLFTGTLNFTAKKARRLMVLGYKDTLDILRKLGQETALQ